MLMVEKIKQVPVLMEAPSFQDPVKPYCGQYKTTVTKSRTWLLRSVRSSQLAPIRIPSDALSSLVAAV